jgi:predicted GH43/DUF377 family glycosyl hydrolase
MRTYPIGTILLDLDDPKRILGQLRQQLLSPALDEQDGYVPNVFYSCDALAHAETMVLTYRTGVPRSVSRRCRCPNYLTD